MRAWRAWRAWRARRIRHGRSPLRSLVVFTTLMAGLVIVLRRDRPRVDQLRIAARDSALDSTARAMADTLDANPDVALATPADAIAVTSALAAPERDSAQIAFTLNARAGSTYLGELLDDREGWNYRWPDRRVDPMRVWVQTAANPSWDAAFPDLVRDGFSAWSDLGLPLLFTFTLDSARAEVLVTWVDRFPERMTGRTLWRHDQHGWIVGGTIELALHLPDGRPVTRDGIRAIARHEVGHLIGLDHPRDSTSVMAAQVFVTELNEADRRTARLVYDLPPGRMRP